MIEKNINTHAEQSDEGHDSSTLFCDPELRLHLVSQDIYPGNSGNTSKAKKTIKGCHLLKEIGKITWLIAALILGTT